MEDVGIFYGHLVHFTVFCYILLTFGIVRGNLVYFPPFWYFVPRKIWQPCSSGSQRNNSSNQRNEFQTARFITGPIQWVQLVKNRIQRAPTTRSRFSTSKRYEVDKSSEHQMHKLLRLQARQALLNRPRRHAWYPTSWMSRPTVGNSKNGASTFDHLQQFTHYVIFLKGEIRGIF
jgi:hypothetical protein